jgi:hypothetical protein
MHRRFSIVLILVTLILCVAPNVFADKKPLTNSDIVKMVKGGLPSEVIIEAIKSSEQTFDVSPDELISLKQQSVPDNFIKAMVAITNPNKTSDLGNTNTIDANVRFAGTLSEVMLIDGTSRVQMKYSNPSGGRTAGMGMKIINPFGKIKLMQSLNGKHASLRTTNPSPFFEISIPSDWNPRENLVLVKFKVKSDKREISTAEGRLGASVGFNKDDLIPLMYEDGPSKNGGSTKVYRISISKSLSLGEYALVVQSGTFYDFGVDTTK